MRLIFSSASLILLYAAVYCAMIWSGMIALIGPNNQLMEINIKRLLLNFQVVSEKRMIKEEFCEDQLFVDFDNKKNDCKESFTKKIKEESLDLSDGHDYESSSQEGVGCSKIMGHESLLKEQMFGNILMKEEIKEEDLEVKIPLCDQAEERFNSQEEISANATYSELVGKNCLHEKAQCLPSNIQTGYSHSTSERLLFPGSGKGKKSSFTDKEKIGSLKHHERTQPEKLFKCISCPYQAVSKRDMNSHERTHRGQKTFKCGSCFYQATKIRALKNHERTHTGERPYKCTSCSYQAAQSEHLKRHERKHTGEKPYKCSSCPYQAAQIGNLKEHERTHTGQRPFKCTSCSYRATQLGALKHHERTHTGERPFKCSSCPYQASQIGNLKKHERTHTGERPFKCILCSYRATQLGALNKHERTHTVEKRFKAVRPKR